MERGATTKDVVKDPQHRQRTWKLTYDLTKATTSNKRQLNFHTP